jgi:hypothetical protein
LAAWFDDDVLARLDTPDRIGHRGCSLHDLATQVRGQYDNRELSPTQVLLRVDASVVRHKNIESALFGKRQQLSVFGLLPVVRIRRCRKAGGFKGGCEMSWHTLVEEHALGHG